MSVFVLPAATLYAWRGGRRQASDRAALGKRLRRGAPLMTVAVGVRQNRGDVGRMIENYAIDAIQAFLQTWAGEEAL